MAFTERQELIKRIEHTRQSNVICYLTSLRPGLQGQMGDDAVRVFFDHLLALGTRRVKRLDIFLCSNGGNGTIPWRLVSLFREFADEFNVLIPYRAYSAATLLALGANEIVMHPFGELGPIDPTVSNQFNPIDPTTNQIQGISVEDVTAYVQFIKATVGITHEDELVQAINKLTEKVHPLALGNVERFISQSRMIAKKILRTHMGEDDIHTIDEIVENLASKLYFHGHPINRIEAATDLRLKVLQKVPPELEDAMWELYRDYEDELNNLEIFDPAADLAGATPTFTVVPQPTQGIPQPGSAQPAVPQATGLQPGSQGPMVIASAPSKDYDLVLAIIESRTQSSAFHSRMRAQALGASGPVQTMIRLDNLGRGWHHQPSVGASAHLSSTTVVGGAQRDGEVPSIPPETSTSSQQV